MPGAPELGSIVDAAERAAAAGDFVSAEQLLRQAAVIQEAQLGESHPGLANTLNNLGVVCERLDKPGDAEACYRRAYAIATTSLPPDDPLVATSGQNLRDFCSARGLMFELPQSPAPPPAPAPPKPPEPSRLQAGTHSPPAPATVGETAPSSLSRSWIAGVAIAVTLGLLLFVLFGAPWSRSDAPSSRAQGPASSPYPDSAPVAPSSPPSAAPSAKKPPVAPAPGTSRRSAPVTAAVEVVEARLCRTLSNWKCEQTGNPAAPGVFFFYTRVRSAGDARVLHRWYHEGKLLRTASLRVGANSGTGYRTYSRNTVNADRSGNWTVELATESGERLHEERFSVR